MTSSQRDPMPRPSLFERRLREVTVADARGGARVHGAFGEWLDGAGGACEQARNLGPDGRLSTVRARAGIAAMVRATVRRPDEQESA
ncbi:hypothetical protein [Tahibacter sp.]|uniref:hypothetical protein n=1 Tax=Tahibacter sp. TaxID=2056211 RepID=UPI0028C50006|nr:hypothetical protein [Tahibacter sp.]